MHFWLTSAPANFESGQSTKIDQTTRPFIYFFVASP